MFVRRSRLREAERQAALLRRHALEDPLTGLGNRRSAERRLGALRLGEQPLSLAVVDVDRFKSVNDAASHTQGDAVLRRVADLLREHSRTGDEVYRWAGDEFLVVLPTATEPQAVVVAERLRSAVAAADWSDLQLPEPGHREHRRGQHAGHRRRRAGRERRLAGPVRRRRPAPVLGQAERPEPGPRPRRRSGRRARRRRRGRRRRTARPTS